MKIVLMNFPKSLVNISNCFNENINNDTQVLSYILNPSSLRMAVDYITTKEMQVILKTVQGKVKSMNFDEKLEIENFDTNNILRFRMSCKNAKFRNIYFSLIHKDFFTHLRMKKYNMTLTDQCPRCGDTETIGHLLWECSHVKEIWSVYNNLSTKWNKIGDCVLSYDDIYKIGSSAGMILIKIKLIQELILNRFTKKLGSKQNGNPS
jgi:hypothetical protein